ncbi:MAG: TRAP transporter large permease subunit, partial [Noviherbaspirillum sp.]
TGMIILIICGAFMLNVTLTALSVPQMLTTWITGLGVTPTVFIFILILLYLVLGCFLEVLSMQVTTIPIAYPVAVAMGVDPIWFGIFIVLMSEIALITPPVGMNLYVVHGIRRDGGPISDVIRGVWPYVWLMLAFVVLLWYVPGIALWLPRTMF